MPTKANAALMMFKMVSDKELVERPVPATSGEVRPWARAGELKIKNAKLKVKSETKKIRKIKIPPRKKIYDLCFFEESIGIV